MPRSRLTHEMTHQSYETAIRERFVQLFPEPEYLVIGGPDAHWPGRLSEVNRQIDVGVVRCGPQAEYVLVVDAKRRSAKLDLPEVESFLGFMDDVGCCRGVLASLLGGSPAAARRASAGGVELHVVSYSEALAFDWPRVAAGLYPWDSAFHPVLVECLRCLNRGRIDDFIETAEELPFEEWEKIHVCAPQAVRATAERALREIAESHVDDAWRFNALRILDETYGEQPREWLLGLRAHEPDPETREQLRMMLNDDGDINEDE